MERSRCVYVSGLFRMSYMRCVTSNQHLGRATDQSIDRSSVTLFLAENCTVHLRLCILESTRFEKACNSCITIFRISQRCQSNIHHSLMSSNIFVHTCTLLKRHDLGWILEYTTFHLLFAPANRDRLTLVD